MRDEMMDHAAEPIVDHGVIVVVERNDIVIMHRYAGGRPLRAITETVIEDLDLEAEDAPPAAIWGNGRLYASINEIGDRATVHFFVCPHCLEPEVGAIPFFEWMATLAGASAPPDRCR